MIGESEASSKLTSYGILPTLQRLQIARVILGKNQHLSADQVLAMVSDSGVRVSKATIYNTLGLFARKGVVGEVTVDPARVYYDTNSEPHHHFYNEDSGELFDIKHNAIDIDRLPNAPKGTTTENYEVIVRVRNKR